MEFYLEIKNGIINDIKYYTEGCEGTRACASMAASMAFNKTVKEALSISAGEVIKRLEGLSEEHIHCAILSVMTLYKAIADYLLQL
jgi:nitrogen fixation NifU-like protein